MESRTFFSIYLFTCFVTFFFFIPICLAHGALGDEGSEGWGPFIFIPVIIAFGLFILLATKKKGWTILVIGGAGYIGSTLVQKLLDKGHRVTVIDSYCAGKDGLKGVQNNLDLKQVKGDLSDTNQLDEALRGCDAIIYLEEEGLNNTDETFVQKSDYLCTQRIKVLLEKADIAGVQKLIFTSSMSVYGKINCENITEDTPLKPSSGFSDYLVSCEKLIESKNIEGVDTCIVRSSAIIGPSKGSYITGELNKIFCGVINNKSMGPIPGFKAIPFVHIQDLCDLYLFLLNQPGPKIDRQIFNVGSGVISDDEVFQTLKKKLKRSPKLKFKSSRNLVKRTFSFKKMTDYLGFKPQYKIYDGATDLIVFCRKNGTYLNDDRNTPLDEITN